MKRIRPVIFALAAALIIKLFVFDFIIANGHSMEPAFTDGNILLISRIRYGLRLPFFFNAQYLVKWARPRTGDVIVFYTPDGELAVKRCVRVENSFFYAEGDNSLASYDSRAYGRVPAENIIGKVLGH